MADDLKTIVQRMVDGGESEENIATVIQHFKTQAAPQPDQDMQAFGRRVMADRAGAILPPRPSPVDELGNTAQPQGFARRMSEAANNMFGGMAHPTSLGDIAGLLLPNSMGAGETSLPNLARGTARILKAGGQAAADGSYMGAPIRFIRGAMQSMQDAPKTVAEAQMVNYNRLPKASQQPSVPPSLGSGPSASDFPTLSQGTFAKLPNGKWAVTGQNLVEGAPVNITNRSGVGNLHTVDKVLGPDELDQLVGMSPRPPGTDVATIRALIMQRLRGQ